MSPSSQLRQLVAVRALSAFSYYSFMPFVPLWAERNLAISPVTAGGALAISLLATRAGGILLPPLIEAAGNRAFIRASYASISVVYLVIASQNRIGAAELFGAFGLVGLLQSGSTVALKSSIAGLAGGYAGLRGYAALSMAVNAGSAVGPVFGALLLDSGQFGLPALAAVAMAVAALLSASGPDAGATRSGPAGSFVLPGRRLVGFLLTGSLTWLGYAVAFDAMPTAASRLVDERVVALAFGLNAVVLIAGQPAVTRWLVGRSGSGPARVVAGSEPARMVAGANLLAGAGLCVMALMPWAGAASLLVGVLVFSSSELLWGPLYDAGTLARAGRMSATAAFGLAGCVFGIAESAAAWSAVAVAGPAGGIRVMAVFGAAAAAALLAVPLLAAMRSPSNLPQISEVTQ